jgi:hypothetical protein
MTKADLESKTVAELKALARKKKVSLSAEAKKADIVKKLLAVVKAAKPAAKKAAASLKKTVTKAVARVRSTEKKAAPAKPAARKAVAPRKSAAAKELAPTKRTPAGNKPVTSTPIREWKLPPGVEEPLMAQERVSEAKYYTGPAMHSPVPAHGELPQGYGDDKISLMMRDPFVAYAYWETSPARLEREKSWFGWSSKLCVRIYDITGVQFDGRNAIGFYDQEIFDRTGNWYFDLGRPSHSFCADLGLLSPEGRFLTLVRSNYITMPQDGVSDVIDEQWMLVDEEFWKLYGYEGFKRGVSSPEMQEMLKRRRELEISSPGLFSRERAKRK